MVWLFPIHFKSDIKNDIIIDENKLKLRRMTDDEIYQLFKIRVGKRSEDGLIEKCSVEAVGTFISDPISAILLNDKFFVMSSQYILEAEEIECVNWFQQALKLYKDGKTGAFWGFNTEPPEFYYLQPNPFYGVKVYSLDESDVPKVNYSPLTGRASPITTC